MMPDSQHNQVSLDRRKVPEEQTLLEKTLAPRTPPPVLNHPFREQQQLVGVGVKVRQILTGQHIITEVRPDSRGHGPISQNSDDTSELDEGGAAERSNGTMKHIVMRRCACSPSCSKQRVGTLQPLGRKPHRGFPRSA